MQINLNSNIPLIQRSPDNDLLPNRPARQGNENPRESVDQSRAQGQQSGEAVTSTGTLLASTQRVNASGRNEQSNFKNVSYFFDVSPQNRKALESYVNAAQTQTQPSDVELVGIDIFV